jgi:hypothetical protein
MTMANAETHARLADSRLKLGPARLLDRVRDSVRARHYSIRTEEAYAGWVRRFVLFHGKRHPSEMGEPEINSSDISLGPGREARR